MDSFIDMLVGNRCLVCHQPNSFRQRICLPCQHAMRHHSAVCSQCQVPLPDTVQTHLCAACLTSVVRYNQLFSIGPYETELARLITAFKYRGNRAYGRGLCDVWLAVNTPHITVRPDLLISVPLSLTRRMKRGFNQSAYLATTLSKRLAIPHSATTFTRQGTSPQMVTLNKAQRQKAVRKQYQLSTIPTVNHVAIVDDVVTTGATVDALCQQLIHQIPDITIDIWCLARTPI